MGCQCAAYLQLQAKEEAEEAAAWAGFSISWQTPLRWSDMASGTDWSW
jgi:hypothetical protein